MITSVENITLQPHPLDAWAKALDALITCAPGNETEISQYLSAAMRKLFVGGRNPRISNLQVRTVQRLVTASNIDADIAFNIEQQVRHNECGFRDRPAAGETAQPDPAGHTASPASPDRPDQWAIRPIPTGEASPLAFRDPARQQFRPLPSDGATHRPAHLSAPPASRLAQS
jgi:hypothetical protein